MLSSSRLVVSLLLLIATADVHGQTKPRPEPDFEILPFSPKHTIVYRTPSRLTVDGKLDEAAWRAAEWSDAFVDIEGDARPRPRFTTRMKMLWDDEFLYIAADMLEPDVWATLTTRDAVIFQDNDFEVFIDPDGDTHEYYELEVNALKTAWDLLLPQPYRDGGSAIDGWDIAGLQVGVDIRGTLNKPGDKDDGWSVELALPWNILEEASTHKRAPRDGEQWRINFSRVEWHTDIVDGRYVKRMNAETKKPLPEDNWVWSPQGAINMHMPERWGVMQFSSVAAGTEAARAVRFVEDPNDRVKWALRRLYYRQRKYHAEHKRYAADLAALAAFVAGAGDVRVEGLTFAPKLQVTDSLYEITAAGFNGVVLHLRQDGKIWMTKDDSNGR
jgi:Carbohydrate family 9 binding domain-like